MKAIKSYMKRIATISLAAVLVFSTVSSDHLMTYASETQQSDETVTQEPQTQEPQAETSQVEEPLAEEPLAEEPQTQEPQAETPQVEEPQVEEPVVEEPVVEEPLVEEPVVEDPLAEGQLPAEEIPPEGELPVEEDLPIEGELVNPEVTMHKVVFLGIDGNVLAELEVADGEGASAPEAPAVEGYNFTGWDNEFGTITADMTITALYELIPAAILHQITFMGMNGEVLAQIELEEGVSLPTEQIPVAPVIEGFEFTGWDISPEGLVVTSELTITAQYKALVKTFVLTFQGMNGEALGVFEVPEGTTLVAENIPIAPEVPEYTFTGWDRDFSVVTEDMLILAVYEDNFPVFEQAVTLSDGTTITAKADRGIVPKGAQLEAGEVDLTATQTDAVDAAVGEEVEQFAYDIKIRQTDGSEFEPQNQDSIQISFANIAGVEEADTVAIAHVDGDEVNVEAQEAKSGSEAVFAASHFSVYVVAISATMENVTKDIAITNGKVLTLNYLLNEFYSSTINSISVVQGSFTNVSTPPATNVITMAYNAGNGGKNSTLTATNTGSAVITFKFKKSGPTQYTATINITVGEYHYSILANQATYASAILAELGIDYNGNSSNAPRFDSVLGSESSFYSRSNSNKQITASKAGKEAIVTISYKPEGESDRITIEVTLASYSKYTHFALVTTTTDQVTINSLSSVTANGGGYNNTNIPMGSRQSNGLGEYEFQSNSMSYHFTNETTFTVVANITYTPHYYLNGVLQNGTPVTTNHTFVISDYQKDANQTFYEYCAATFCVGNAGNKGIDVKTTYGEIINNFFSVIYSLDGSNTTVMDPTHYVANDSITILGLPVGYSQPGKVFTGWRSNADGQLYQPGTSVQMGTSQITFTAEFRTNFTVWWKIGNTLSEQDNNVPNGTKPVYDKPDPTKAPSGGHAYIFKGWNTNANAQPTAAILEANLPVVQGDITYFAIFEQVSLYTVRWKNGTQTIERDEFVLSGSDPIFNGATPTRPDRTHERFTFVGWSEDYDASPSEALAMGDLPKVESDIIYYAIFSITPLYTVEWWNMNQRWERDWPLLSGAVPDYNGMTPFRFPAPDRFYTFVGWSENSMATEADAIAEANLPLVSKDTKYYAIYRMTRIMNPQINAFYGTYDGNYHGISLTNLPTGVSVYYSLTTPLGDGNFGTAGTLAANPLEIKPYLNAGTYKIYYYITAPGYLADRGSRFVIINPIRLRITAQGEGITKVYDGTTSVPQLLLQSQGLLPGHTIVYDLAEFNSPYVSLAEFVTVFGIHILGGEGEEQTDETGNYIIWFRGDGLRLPGTITLRPFTITADSNSKTFDTFPLTDPDYAITSGSLAPGHELVALTAGSQTDPGTSFNAIASYNIFAPMLEEENTEPSFTGEEPMALYALEDVTENYEVTTVSGNLTVNAAPTPGPGPTPGPTPTPTPTPTTTILPTPAPLANTLPPSTIIIEEEPVILAAAPVEVVEEPEVIVEDIVEEEPQEEPLEEIEEPEVPLANIEEDEVPLAPAVDNNCWIHWLILILTALYTGYEIVRGLARKKKINELSEAQENTHSHTTA